MSIQHKEIEHDWGNGFATNNAILNTTPYKPEVMFVGTFNPNTPNANFSDFFYGRNFFWPGLKNLFIHNDVVLLNRRMPANGIPDLVLNPSSNEIFELCSNLKLCFTDLILEVLHADNVGYEILANDKVAFGDNTYNLIQDGQNNGILGLAQLNQLNQINWNTQNIIDFLCNNPQIQNIYLTRQPNGVWGAQWNLIQQHPCMSGRNLTNIYTPSGQGLVGQPRMAALLHHWVHNVNPAFGQLNNDWLINHGVNIHNF